MSEDRSEAAQRWGNLPFSLRQMTVVAAALLVGAFLGWLLFAGHGGGGRGGSLRPRVIASKFHAVMYPTLGLSVAEPDAWQSSEQRGVVKLLSPEQSVSIAISTPAGAGQDAQLRRLDITDLQRLFRPVQLVGRRRGIIGGRSALTTELLGTSPRHIKIRILSTAVSSAYRTYSIQAFSAQRPPAQRLLELRAVLGSVRFSAPKK